MHVAPHSAPEVKVEGNYFSKWNKCLQRLNWNLLCLGQRSPHDPEVKVEGYQFSIWNKCLQRHNWTLLCQGQKSPQQELNIINYLYEINVTDTTDAAFTRNSNSNRIIGFKFV